MRMAVVGAAGQLGRDLVRAAGDAGSTVLPLGHEDIEVTDPRSVDSALEPLEPDVVVNCAAYVRVDDAENEPELAFRTNALGALHVARGTRKVGARCVYISTDYVFSGEKDSPYDEDDPPAPRNVYGASKLAGEILTRQGCPADHLIVRTASLFGKAGARGKGGNFVEAILKRAASGDPLKVVDDVRITPTYTRHLARALLLLLEDGPGGTAHLANRGSTTWYGFARRALDLSGFEEVEIRPVSSAEYGARADRPPNSALVTARSGGFLEPLAPWEDALAEYLSEREAGT